MDCKWVLQDTGWTIGMVNTSDAANVEVKSTTTGTRKWGWTNLDTWSTSVANSRLSQTHEEVELTQTQGPLSEQT